MMTCSEARPALHPYLDAELTPDLTLELERHLIECAPCRAQYEDLRLVVDAVRGARPLYEVPEGAALRARRQVVHREQAPLRWFAVAAAVIVAVSLGVAMLSSGRRGAAREFAEFAVETHRGHAGGAIPLSLVSSRPDEVSHWLQARLSFPVAFPDYPSLPGRPKPYELTGASLLLHNGEKLGYLSYRMAGRPISLLMTATEPATPDGGVAYQSGRLTFRFVDWKGLKLITWSDHGIYYCLVSDLGVNGAESCIVCHGSEAERHRILHLTPGVLRN